MALAALLSGAFEAKGRTVAIVLSGGNVDPHLFADIICNIKELARQASKSVREDGLRLGMISRRHFLTLTAATAGAGMIGAADALAVEPGFSLILKEWTVEHPDWPAAAPSLRIGILTDIHAVEPWMSARRIGGIVDQLNAQKPDIIVLLGDYVNGLRRRYCTREVPVAEWMAPLQTLSAPLGVYAILGNHDFWSHQVPDIRRAFGKAGIPLLENTALKVSRGRDHFWIAGLKDQLAFE